MRKLRVVFGDVVDKLGKNSDLSSNIIEKVDFSNTKMNEIIETAKETIRSCEELRKQLSEEIEVQKKELQEILTLSKETLTTSLQKQVNDLKVIYEQKTKELDNVLTELEPLLRLPKAFSTYIKRDEELVRKGTAKIVCDELGLNKDNVSE